MSLRTKSRPRKSNYTSSGLRAGATFTCFASLATLLSPVNAQTV